MTDSITTNFIATTHDGDCAEVRGHLVIIDGHYHIPVNVMKQILRIYNQNHKNGGGRVQPSPPIKLEDGIIPMCLTGG